MDEKPVGIIGLLNIDARNGKAEYYITLGERGYLGRGVARKASELLLEYAFHELNLNRVYLFTEVENLAAQRLFERLGFRKEGLLRGDVKKGSRYVHRFVFGLTKEDYERDRRIGRCGPAEELWRSPIHESNLDLHGNRLFYKREDLLPFSFGGNKARKARFFFEDIEKSGNDCVVTYGSNASNHCRVIANMAAQRQLPCYIISPVGSSQPTVNSRMVELLNGHRITCSVDDVSTTIEATLRVLRHEGLKPYFIEGGGHGVLGTQAYVDCYDEIVLQEAELGLHFDYVFLASGTGTTQAGLVCGRLLHGHAKEIVGISIARKNPRGHEVIRQSILDFIRSRKLGLAFNEDSVQFVDDYVLEGYASVNRELLDVIYNVFLNDGVPLDMTYTGKAFWGMHKYLQERRITGKNVLFLHTGGTPLFFDGLGEVHYARTHRRQE